MSIYTEEYKKTQADFDKAEKMFDAHPCKKTATELSNLRTKLKNMTSSEMYTPEYLKQREIERKEADKLFMQRLSNYANTIKIETAAENGLITDAKRIELHKLNDMKNPL